MNPKLSYCSVFFETVDYGFFLFERAALDCFYITFRRFCQIDLAHEHPSSCSVFLIRMFFYKNLIVLHHVYNNFLFWYLHRIYTFNNNVNEEGMIKSQMVCVTIVTRNNIVKKLARSYCLCYCATFSLVVDSKECTMFFTEECSTLFVPLKIK